MNIVKIISTEIDKNKSRIIKFLRKGQNDVQTSNEAMAYGLDSNPIENMVAIYAETSQKGRTVIIGYINKNQLAAPGEYRTYSTDAAGNMKFYTWLKNDGTYEIGGTVDNMVRFSKLKEAFDELQNDVKTFKAAFGSWVVAPGDGGAALKAVAIAWSTTPITKSIDPAKITEVKTL